MFIIMKNRYLIFKMLSCIGLSLSLWVGDCEAFSEPNSGEPYGIVLATEGSLITAIDDESVKSFFKKGITEARLAPGSHKLNVAYVKDNARSTSDIIIPIDIEAGARHILKVKAVGFKGMIVFNEESIENYGSPDEVKNRQEYLDFKRISKANSLLLYKEFLIIYPNGNFSQEAISRLSQLQKERSEIINNATQLFVNAEITIDSLQDNISEGAEMSIIKQVSLKDGVESTNINVKFSGGGNIYEGCVICAEILKLPPNHIEAISTTHSIITGTAGATLKRLKGSKKIVCLEGEAYLYKK